MLNALVPQFPRGSVVMAVVDPGVGSDRLPICFKLNSKWYVGPDNGVFSRVLSRSERTITVYEIPEMEGDISRTFHGRDVFAPAAVQLAHHNDARRWNEISVRSTHTFKLFNQWQDDLDEIIYIDGFGNCMTGFSLSVGCSHASVKIGELEIQYAETFSEVEPGQVFWYFNSIGLLEIAVNQGSADKMFGWTLGTRVQID